MPGSQQSNSAARAAAYYAWPEWARRRALIKAGSARMLYKYFAFDSSSAEHLRNVRSILIESKLWFSRPCSFNDPFDFRCDAKFTSDAVELRKYFEKSAKRVAKSSATRKSERKKETSKLVRQAQQRHIGDPDSANKSFLRMRDKYGICCFTTQPKSLLMWAHYGSSHTGLCFQFSVAKHFELLGLARGVSYGSDFPVLEWPRDKDTVLEKVLFRKYDVWRYESERRIIDADIADAGRDFYPQALTGVICGHRMSQDSMDKLRGLLLERERLRLPPIRIYRSVPAVKSYEMKVEEIS